MCGISGIISLQGTQANSRALQAMNDCLKHRGPDGEGFLFYDGLRTHTAFGKDTPEHICHAPMPHAPAQAVTDLHGDFIFGFGHRRLAILDLGENGHQPLCNISSDLWITYNGEIYNYLELRTELQQKGHSFRTRTDTEVVLAAYREWGTDCLKHFNGMWAFVLFDSVQKIFFGSRDRFGVKPFYYYTDKKQFVFASEQKALLRLPDIRSGINPKAVADYFIAGEIEYEQEGVFQNILELFPAQAFTIGLDNGVYKQWKWYELKTNESYESFNPDTFKTYRNRTEELISDAVRLRLRSDVPVGSCLSGGIDSSSIVGLMSSFRKQDPAIPPFHTFTASFPGLTCDETSWARIAAEQSESVWHHAQPTLPELVKDLEQLVYSQDSPLWSTSTYAQFRVMRLVQEQGIKVILDGQGGDELFAGYSPYYTRYIGDMLNHFRFGTASGAIRHAGPFPYNILSLGKTHLKNNLLHRLPASLQVQITRSYFKDMDFLNPSLVELYTDEKKKKSDPRPASLNGLLHKEFINTRLKLYLKCEDRSSMWHSVESRTPFADDHTLIEYIFNIPGSYKIHQGKYKYLLREAMKAYIPQPILERTDKMGYNTPNNEWVSLMKDDVKDYFTDALKSYLHIDKLRKEYDSFFNISKTPENGRIFKFMAFAAWYKVFKP